MTASATTQVPPIRPRGHVGRLAPSVAVIGVGNLHRRDDAAGILAARRIGQELGERVRVFDGIRDTADLINAWEGADLAILIDAAQVGGPVGAIYEIEVGEWRLPEHALRCSTHSLNVAQAIELSRVLDALPSSLAIWGIEGSSFDMGRELSPEVEEAIEKVASQVVSRVRRFSEVI